LEAKILALKRKKSGGIVFGRKNFENIDFTGSMPICKAVDLTLPVIEWRKEK